MTENEYVRLTAKVRLELVLNQLRDINGYYSSERLSEATKILYDEYSNLIDEVLIDVS